MTPSARRIISRTGWTVAALSIGAWAASMWAITWRSSNTLNAFVLREGIATFHNLGTYTLVGWTCLGPWYDTSLATRPFVLRWWPEEGTLWRAWDAAPGVTHWSLSIPLWMPTLAGTALALAFHPRRTTPAARCPKCNYDLNGLPANATCPECGPNAKP